jgi:hypothetical protein
MLRQFHKIFNNRACWFSSLGADSQASEVDIAGKFKTHLKTATCTWLIEAGT